MWRYILERCQDLQSPSPNASDLVNDWLHEALRVVLRVYLNAWVPEGMQEFNNLTAEKGRHVWARFTRRGVAVELDIATGNEDNYEP